MDKETQIEVEKNGQELLNRIERERERYLARIKHHYNQRKKKSSLFTWKITDDDDDSPCLEEPKLEPLHNLRRILVTGIQDL